MADDKSTTVVTDGDLAVKTLSVSGTQITGPSALETTTLVQTDDGVELAVKVFPLGEGGGGGGGGDSVNYNTQVTNKPQINGTTLSGNKTGADLGLLDLSGGTLTDALNVSYDETDPTEDSTAVNAGSIEIKSFAPFVSLNTTDEETQPVESASVDMFNAIHIPGVRDNTGSTGDVYDYDNYRAQINVNPQYGNTKLELASGSTSKPVLYRTYLQNNVQVSENALFLNANGQIPADNMTGVVELTTTSVELASDTIYNGAELASVTFTLPATVPANFTAQLNFTSGTTATTFTAPATVTFEGDACSNGVFTPLASKRYSVLIYTDGVNVIGLVMGN